MVRLATVLAGALFVLAMSTGRAASDMVSDKLTLIPEKESLWRESDLWDKNVTLRAGLGYKDNVLLAPSAPRGSAFFNSGLDAAVNRLPLDGLEFIFFLTGDDSRYWHNVGVNGEDLFVLSAQVLKYLDSGWRVGLEFKENYIDQVQFILVNGALTPAEVKGNILVARPFVRREMGENCWIQLEPLITREYLGAPLDDSWKFGTRVVVGGDYGHRSSLSLSYSFFYQAHDTLLVPNTADVEVAGKRLAAWQHLAEANWEHYWDAPRHWRSSTKVGFACNQDNGGGFYNYYKYQAAEELRYRTRDWELKAAIKVSYDHFPVARADNAVAGSPKLYRTFLDLTLRAERRLYKSVKLYGEYEHEKTFSNAASDEYTANIVTGGISYEF